MPIPAGIPIALGGAAFLNWLFNRNATDKAADRQFAALDKAHGAIQGAADKAMGYQQPYLENAGKDFSQMRGLVQSGFFQQPYGQSFQSQSYSPAGFSFNPSQGTASFSPWQPQGAPASFSGQGLPGLPALQPQANQAQAGPMMRPNASPQSLSEWSMNAGAQQAQQFPQNMPSTMAMTRPGMQNPLNPNAFRNPFPSNPAVQPMDIASLLQSGLLKRPGSGPYMPGGRV
jgi:hypothetical protein